MFQKNNSSNEINTIIGKNSCFKGVFSLKGALKVEGCYEGENLSVESIFVTASGKVKSNIKANTVVAEGIIIGNIEAKNRVMLMPTSRILGEIKTPELIIQNGAILEGLCVIAPTATTNPKDGIFALYNGNNNNSGVVKNND